MCNEQWPEKASCVHSDCDTRLFNDNGLYIMFNMLGLEEINAPGKLHTF